MYIRTWMNEYIKAFKLFKSFFTGDSGMEWELTGLGIDGLKSKFYGLSSISSMDQH